MNQFHMVLTLDAAAHHVSVQPKHPAANRTLRKATGRARYDGKDYTFGYAGYLMSEQTLHQFLVGVRANLQLWGFEVGELPTLLILDAP